MSEPDTDAGTASLSARIPSLRQAIDAFFVPAGQLVQILPRRRQTRPPKSQACWPHNLRSRSPHGVVVEQASLMR